ncbi:hypothetical protein BDK92_7172 [Micromonospora pisi]|uniref:Uncharacterized protein n=1 Tax=Micromonospora pisi TaxID=589240 RepID=A0A495JWQ9_9ACTN|nr:DUF6573 family protein [Micromonospora pisi]RKR92694.1 hypothetical protein BDK92_7172 [Micromonospora pisi]
MFTEDDIIHRYTRAQALADGTLIDAGPLAREAGFRWPVALTAAAWADCVAWTDADNKRKGAIQDETGRLWDVLNMARFAAARSGGGNRILFQLVRVPVAGKATRPRLVTLALMAGPGDNGEPVMVIGTPDED